jgi:hypothetical protein
LVLYIVAIAIQATGGSGMGLKIEPYEAKDVKPGSTIQYVITITSYKSDCFDVMIDPYNCKPEWFDWLEKKRVCVRAKEQIALEVTPSKKGNFEFMVKAVSLMNPGKSARTTAKIMIITENRKPTCIALMPEPEKPQPQASGTAILWIAYAYDPEGDKLWYRFLLDGPSTCGLLVVQDWSTSNKWTWYTDGSDVGDSSIYVDVRDGYHATDFTTPDYDLPTYQRYLIV